jgi:hypothetical protein
MVTYQTVKVPHGQDWKWGVVVSDEQSGQSMLPQPQYDTELEAQAEVDRLTIEAAGKAHPPQKK